MKKLLFPAVLFAIVRFIGVKYLLSSQNNDPHLSSIRIGWQIPWSTQGQLTQVLKHTDILKNNGLQGNFSGFTYGAPLNEAALSGDVDVVFTADQPAITLLAKKKGWKIVGRLMYNRVSLYVPPDSSIKTVADLKNKTVAFPFGAAVQRMVLKLEREAGLDPAKDVKNINVGIYEQSDMVAAKASSGRWGDIDAFGGFDPTPAIFEQKGLVRNLKTETVVSVVLMSDTYIQRNPGAAEKFLKSVNEAYDYYRQNKDEADKWFVEEAGLDISSEALALAASVEPNVSAVSKDAIRLDFTDQDLVIMQEAADFLYDQKVTTQKVVVKDWIDLSYLNSAMK